VKKSSSLPAEGRVRLFVALVGTGAAGAALAGWRPQAERAVAQAWPPFVLVAGLLAIGALAHAAGLFEAAGLALARRRWSGLALLGAILGVVAAVTVVLNLDTAAAFLTPVAVLAARRRALPEGAFLYGTLFMTNAASLLLPGSNLTNLLVLANHPVSGASFALQMLPAWIAAVAVTAGFVTLRHRRDLRCPAPNELGPAASPLSWSVVGLVAVAGALVVALESPAVPVFVVAAVGAAVAVGRGHLPARRILDAVDPAVLVGLFGLAVGLGTLARAWPSPSRLLTSAGPAATAGLAALASVAVNNLPAAVVFTAHPVAHPRALLLGLNLGPNLAITGSLSAFVWLKAARAVGAQPDWRQITRYGVVLVPVSMAAAGAFLYLAPGGS